MQEAVDELLAQQLQEDNGGFDMLIQNPRGRTRRAPRVERPDVVIAPEPPVSLEQWEATKDYRCLFCPHPTDTLARPPQVPLEQAPWTQFRCGCRVHTVCYALHLAAHDYGRSSYCPVCNTTVLTEEQRQFFRQQPRAEAREPRAVKLWKENEVFREEMREIAKEGRKVGPLYQAYLKDKVAIKEQWKAAVTPSINLIRHHKQIFTKRLKEIQSRKRYLSAQGKYKRKLFRFLYTYDVDQHMLNVGRPKGMPRIRPATRWGTWKEKAWAIFRARI